MRPWLGLVLAVLTHAQQPLPLRSISSFSFPETFFSLPASPQLTISIAICSPQASTARIFLSNSSLLSETSPLELPLDHGYAHWSGAVSTDAFLSVYDLNQGSFQISVSDNGITFGVLDPLPLLGDTSSSQVILFSRSFLPVLAEQPSYPNYTLPPANLSISDIPSSKPNYTLVIAPTSSQLPSLPQTACALLNTSLSTGSIHSEGPWLRDSEGWRSQWLVDGLSPSTNYTAYVIEDALKVSGPIYFATKSASFPCPLVHSLPYCPSIAYAVPLPPRAPPEFGYDAASLPDTISEPLLQYMTNFTTMLSTFACGRDLYSPLQTCADCQARYRSWICTVSFPRCSEPAPGGNTTADNASASSMPSLPLSALQPQPSGSPSRNPYFPNSSYDYVSLAPCLEMCNAVDRACPYFLGIKCPTARFNAAASYGVGYIDGGKEVGSGSTGSAQDQWGNVWCNGN